MSSPARSRPELDLAVVALSARAMARSARRAGLRALAIDLFADADTREHAALAVRSQGSRRGPGFHGRRLLRTLRAETPEGLPIVLGAGFEHAPDLMRAIAQRNPITGAAPEVVVRLKDPARFAALLDQLGVPHPPIMTGADLHLSPAGKGRRAAPGEGSPRRPDDEEPPHPLGFASRPLPAGERWTAPPLALQCETYSVAWLSKRAGASGGAHVRIASAAASGRYLQRRVEGRSVSALFLADGRDVRIFGFSEQWPDPTRRAPYRYGGAIGPIDLGPSLATGIEDALARIAAATGLVGLASADLIVPDGPDEPPFWLIEINPRPGATLDLFDHDETPSLVGLHLDACAGRLPAALPVPARARAAAVVYAPRAVAAGLLRRPVWTADWPSCDDVIPAGGPFCTIVASGPAPTAARALLERRRAELLLAIRVAPAPTSLKAHA